MKDYKLSEIKAICEKNGIVCSRCPFWKKANSVCHFKNVFYASCPEDWQIDEEEQDDDGE